MALKGLKNMTYDEAIEAVLVTILCKKHKIEDIKSINPQQHMVELLEILSSCLRTVVWFDMAIYEELLTEHTKEEIRTMNFYPSVWVTKVLILILMEDARRDFSFNFNRSSFGS